MGDGEARSGVAAYGPDVVVSAKKATPAELRALADEFINDLFSRYHRMFLGAIRRDTSECDPEDIAQEAYTQIARHVQKGALNPAEIDKPENFLVVVGRRVVFDHLRSEKRFKRAGKIVSLDEGPNLDQLPAPLAAQDDALAAKEELAIAYQTIEHLPSLTRRIFQRHRFEGKTYRQIADELDITYFEVVKHIATALHIVQRSLDHSFAKQGEQL